MSDNREIVRIEVHVEAFGGSSDETIEIPRAEWDAMTPEQRSDCAQSCVDVALENTVSASWHIADPDDYASTES